MASHQLNDPPSSSNDNKSSVPQTPIKIKKKPTKGPVALEKPLPKKMSGQEDEEAAAPKAKNVDIGPGNLAMIPFEAP